jgi:tetratricopeptide (TPR) repeat protein
MGNWTDALSSFNNAVIADPGFADAYMKRAMLNRRIGANIDADLDCNRAISLNPSSIYIYDQRFKIELLAIEYYVVENQKEGSSNLSPIQMDHEADYFINIGEYEKALSLTDSLIRMGFEREFEFDKKALLFLLQGDYENCELYADSALMISNDSALPHDLKGLSQVNRGQFENAISSFSKAIEVDPGFAVSYLNRAMAHLRMGKQEAALNDLQTSIQMSQQMASAYYLQGVLLAQKGEMSRSLDSYDAALKLDNTHTHALFNRSFTWKMMGDFRKQWMTLG